MSAVIDDVLDAVVTTVDALGLKADGVLVPTFKRKLPTREEVIDPSTSICVCLAQVVPKPTRFCTGMLLYRLSVEVVLIQPSRADAVASLGQLSDFYGQVRDAFAATSRTKGNHPVTIPAGDDSVWMVKPGEGVFLDRPKLAQQYDYQAQLINVWVLSPTR